MTETSINMRDLRAFPRPVAKVVTEAVNKHGVPYRTQDGSHLRLYCGDRGVTPLKISAERPAEHTLRVLIPWLEQNVKSWLETDVTKASIETLAEVVNTSPKPVKAKPVVASEPEAEVEVSEPEPVLLEDGTQSSFSPGLDIPEDLVCRWEGCGRQAKTTSGYRMHWAGHTGEKKQHAAKGVETYRLRVEQERVVATQALAALAELHGLKIGDTEDSEKTKRLEKQVKELSAQVETLTRERDDALARVSLLNEAFRGLE